MRNGWNWKYPLSNMYPAYTQLVAEWSSPSIGDQPATGCTVSHQSICTNLTLVPVSWRSTIQRKGLSFGPIKVVVHPFLNVRRWCKKRHRPPYFSFQSWIPRVFIILRIFFCTEFVMASICKANEWSSLHSFWAALNLQCCCIQRKKGIITTAAMIQSHI